MCEFLKRFSFKISDGYVMRKQLRFIIEPDDPLVVDLEKRE